MKTFIRTAIVVMIAMFSFESVASAQLLKNILNKANNATATSVSAATSNGQAAGVALKALYTQYKADGKLDMGNLTNLMNLTTLANNVQGLKGMSNKTDFYKEFATGLVMGSNNLVTQNNSNSIMNGLQNLVNNVDLSGLQSKTENAAAKGAAALETATTISKSVSRILNICK